MMPQMSPSSSVITVCWRNTSHVPDQAGILDPSQRHMILPATAIVVVVVSCCHHGCICIHLSYLLLLCITHCNLFFDVQELGRLFARGIWGDLHMEVLWLLSPHSPKIIILAAISSQPWKFFSSSNKVEMTIKNKSSIFDLSCRSSVSRECFKISFTFFHWQHLGNGYQNYWSYD